MDSVPRGSPVLVTGGSGVLGRHVVTALRAGGDDVRVISRRPGAGTHRGDLTTGEGVREALEGVEFVIHAASDTPLGRSDLRQTQTLLEGAQHVRHLLYISIVGVDAIPLGYYKRKLACEQLISASGIPHTILRATQFHELLDRIFTRLARWPVAPLPPRAKVQPVAASEVAARCVELLKGDPSGRAPDFGGPEIHTLRQLLDTWLGRVRLLPLPIIGRTLQAIAEGRNTTPKHAEGRLIWADYLAAR